MARITVEDCLEKIPNRFSLVLVAAERAKQLLKGAGELIKDDRSNKEVVTSLREIAAGVVQADLSAFDENESVDAYGGLATGDLPPEADADLPPAADDDLPPPAKAAAVKDLPPAADDELPPPADVAEAATADA